ncbi:CHAT domain-containing protein [Portibacter marinus]|uniref:CHAT domain-containing protein n=1 Tax=Portibacter marinus TaxID=2898660 RepID=UPI001F1BF5FA|nr:CHAT domain-containing protein [Portibacter marinus]
MLRLLTVLLWIPISTHANVNHIENRETRLELSEILSGMDSTESILIFTFDSAQFVNKREKEVYDLNISQLYSAIGLLRKEYLEFETDPYWHNADQLQLILRDLYDQLISPIEKSLTSRLILIPGALHHQIPWNILLDDHGQYLIENHQISIIADRKLHNRSKLELIDPQELSLYHFAPQFTGLKTLNSEFEKENLRLQFNHFRSNYSEADILHISSHGLPGGLLINDDMEILRSEEIRKFDLNSRLAFINTCYSAEVVQAFLDAGVNSAVANLWQVDDRIASFISYEFYESLLTGSSTSAALRQAILNYRNEVLLKNEDHPFHWGGYQHYGADQTVTTSSKVDFRKLMSIFLSLCTTFSLLSFHFGRKIKGKLIEYNLI